MKTTTAILVLGLACVGCGRQEAQRTNAPAETNVAALPTSVERQQVQLGRITSKSPTQHEFRMTIPLPQAETQKKTD